jgi:hypothetical protein
MRSSGRKERFDTRRLEQTISRSGVPFLIARNIAKKVSEKIKQGRYKGQISNDSLLRRTKGKRRQKTKSVLQAKIVTASRIRSLVTKELRDRNRGDIAASYSGKALANRIRNQNLKEIRSAGRIRPTIKRRIDARGEEHLHT